MAIGIGGGSNNGGPLDVDDVSITITGTSLGATKSLPPPPSRGVTEAPVPCCVGALGGAASGGGTGLRR